MQENPQLSNSLTSSTRQNSHSQHNPEQSPSHRKQPTVVPCSFSVVSLGYKHQPLTAAPPHQKWSPQATITPSRQTETDVTHHVEGASKESPRAWNQGIHSHLAWNHPGSHRNGRLSTLHQPRTAPLSPRRSPSTLSSPSLSPTNVTGTIFL